MYIRVSRLVAPLFLAATVACMEVIPERPPQVIRGSGIGGDVLNLGGISRKRSYLPPKRSYLPPVLRPDHSLLSRRNLNLNPTAELTNRIPPVLPPPGIPPPGILPPGILPPGIPRRPSLLPVQPVVPVPNRREGILGTGAKIIGDLLGGLFGGRRRRRRRNRGRNRDRLGPGRRTLLPRGGCETRSIECFGRPGVHCVLGLQGATLPTYRHCDRLKDVGCICRAGCMKERIVRRNPLKKEEDFIIVGTESTKRYGEFRCQICSCEKGSQINCRPDVQCIEGERRRIRRLRRRLERRRQRRLRRLRERRLLDRLGSTDPLDPIVPRDPLLTRDRLRDPLRNRDPDLRLTARERELVRQERARELELLRQERDLLRRTRLRDSTGLNRRLDPIISDSVDRNRLRRLRDRVNDPLLSDRGLRVRDRFNDPLLSDRGLRVRDRVNDPLLSDRGLRVRDRQRLRDPLSRDALLNARAENRRINERRRFT